MGIRASYPKSVDSCAGEDGTSAESHTGNAVSGKVQFRTDHCCLVAFEFFVWFGFKACTTCTVTFAARQKTTNVC